MEKLQALSFKARKAFMILNWCTASVEGKMLQFAIS